MWSSRSAAFKVANCSSAASTSRPRNRDLPDSNSRRVAELPHDRITRQVTTLQVARQTECLQYALAVCDMFYRNPGGGSFAPLPTSRSWRSWWRARSRRRACAKGSLPSTPCCARIRKSAHTIRRFELRRCSVGKAAQAYPVPQPTHRPQRVVISRGVALRQGLRESNHVYCNGANSRA